MMQVECPLCRHPCTITCSFTNDAGDEEPRRKKHNHALRTTAPTADPTMSDDIGATITLLQLIAANDKYA